MQTLKYILIDTEDDTGNDDGIIERKEMTAYQAAILNEALDNRKSSRIWIPAMPKKANNN